ncbi:MAG: PQQ-binding-like beta-propeller repeat protein [Planctomycetota bacterium]
MNRPKDKFSVRRQSVRAAERAFALPACIARNRWQFRSAGWTWKLFVAAVATLSLVAHCRSVQAAEVIDRSAAIDQHELYFGAHLPRDRSASRAVDVAAQLIKQERYSEAIPLLLSTLAKPEDAFMRAEQGAAMSLRRQASQLLATLPAAGMRAYELESDAAGERELIDAIASGQPKAVAEVVRRRPHSSPASHAVWLLGVAYQDSGENELARAAYQRLAGSSHGSLYEPQLSLRRALACIQLDEQEQAIRIMESLAKSLHVTAQIEGFPSLTDPSAMIRALQELLPEASGSAGFESRHASDWLRVGGNRRGNALPAGGEPHLWSRWSAFSVIDPQDEDRLISTMDWLSASRQSLAPAAQPIAVDDLVIMRTPDNLVAIDWSTGRRVWETDSDDDLAGTSSQQIWRRLANNDGESTLTNPETLQMWFDAVTASLSSDGERVYAIDRQSNAASRHATWSALGQVRRQRGRAALEPMSNRLLAYDLASEGKLAWSTGVTSGSELQDAYFLCSPQPVGDHLLVIAEAKQTIYLLDLDPRSGQKLWKQPIVSVERGVDQNPMRRLIGTATAVSGSTAICSTGVGVVAAVDLLDHSILWVDRFPATSGRQPAETLPWRRRVRENWPQDSTKTWRENRVAIYGNRVVVASPESQLLHCLDLETGEPVWRVPRGESSYLTFVTETAAIAVGANSVVAHDLTTGEPTWRTPLPDEVTISGRPAVSIDGLLVPLSDGSLSVLDTDTGATKNRRPTSSDSGLGNLIVHRGAIVSQTPLSLDRFDERRGMLDAALANLSEDPDDPQANCRLGEIKQSDGMLDEAIAHFERAYRAKPYSALVRSRLRQALEQRISIHGPTATDLATLGPLIESPQQQVAWKVRRIEHAVQQGKAMEAIRLAESLLSVAETLPDTAFVGQMSTTSGQYATPLHRVSGLLATAWQQSNAEQRDDIARFLEELRNQPATLQHRESRLHMFAALPGIDAARERLIDAMLEEENNIGHRLYLASQALSAQRNQGSIRSAVTSATTGLESRWATQQVAAEVKPRKQPDARERTSGRRPSNNGWRRLSLVHASPKSVDQSGPAWEEDLLTSLDVSLDTGELVGLDRYGEILFKTSLARSAPALVQQLKSSEAVEAWRFGPCLYLAAGEHVIAIELIGDNAAAERQLWSTEGLIATYQRKRRGANRWGGLRASESVPPLDPSAQAKIVMVGEAGVVISKGDALLCVDALRGDLRWLRHDRTYAEQVADERFVYTVTDSDGPVRLSLLDGSDAGGWQPPPGNWLGYRRGLLTTSRRKNGALTVETTRLSTGERMNIEKASGAVRTARIDDWGIALLASDGRLAVVDLRVGMTVIESELPLSGVPRSLQVEERAGRLIVVIGYASPRTGSTVRYASLDGAGVVSGDVFCLDRQTGESLWPRPVALKNRGWLSRQPCDSPLLTFATRREERTSRRATVTTQLLVLDVASGRTIYRDDSVDENSFGTYRINYQERPMPELQLTLPQSQVVLRTVQSPAPPAPPAFDAIESPRLTGDAGTLVQQLQRAFRGALETRPSAGNREPDDD